MKENKKVFISLFIITFILNPNMGLSDPLKIDNRIELNYKLAANTLFGQQSLPIETIKSIIDPRDISTGMEVVNVVDYICDTSYEEVDYNVCDRLLITACSIFKGYSCYPGFNSNFLNEEGLKTKAIFDEMLDKRSKTTGNWNIDDYKTLQSLASTIPTIRNPNPDLFIDVLDGFTEKQLWLLIQEGSLDLARMKGIIWLQLTHGCSNQCEHCSVSKGKGSMFHMPFPLVVKVINRMSKYANGIEPFYNSDPLDYHDKVINATFDDVVHYAKENNYTNVVSLTNGLGAGQAKKAEAVLSKLENRIIISFHMCHPLVVSYAQLVVNKEIQGAEIEKRRERIVRKYVEGRFVPVIRGAIDSGQSMAILRLDLLKSLPPKLKEYPNVVDVLKLIQELQDEVLGIVRGQILEERNIDIDDVVDKEMEPFPMQWINDATLLLRKLGVNEEDIASIKPISTISRGDGVLVMRTDGSITMQFHELESPQGRYRTVAKCFDSFRAPEFRQFLDVLKIVLDVHKHPFLYENRKKVVYSRNTLLKHLSNDIKTSIAQKLREMRDPKFVPGWQRLVGYDPESDKSILKSIKYFYIKTDRITTLLSWLDGFVIDRKELQKRLNNLNEDNLVYLYNTLRDFPFPITMVIGVQTKDDKLYDLEFSLMDESNPFYKGDIYRWNISFPLQTKIFETSSASMDEHSFGLGASV